MYVFKSGFALLLSLTVLLGILFTNCLAFTNGQNAFAGKIGQSGSSVKPPEVLATFLYPGNNSMRQLTLWKVIFPPPDVRELLGNPTAEFKPIVDPRSFVRDTGTLAFILVDSPVGNPMELKEGRVIAFVYGSDSSAYPRTKWLGSIVSNPLKKEMYLLLGRSQHYDVTFSVYRLDLTKEIARYPLALHWKRRSELPTPSPQLSELKIELPADACGISRLEAIASPDHLLIYAERPASDCPPIYFRFNLTSKEWTEITWQKMK